MTVTPVEQTAEERGAVTRHTYPTSAMAGDYLRAAAGLLPVVAVFATASVDTVVAVLLGGFGA
ncbi:MAG: hypothetical protein ACREFB_09030, partial [Stellaceae bacterium]